jgi:hypothetical protein
MIFEKKDVHTRRLKRLLNKNIEESERLLGNLKKHLEEINSQAELLQQSTIRKKIKSI